MLLMDLKLIKPEIIKYLDKLKNQIKIDKAILFGSCATQKQTQNSDVDLLIISADFASLDSDERSRLLYRASVGFPYDLHVHGITQTEYDHASHLTTLGLIKSQPSVTIH